MLVILWTLFAIIPKIKMTDLAFKNMLFGLSDEELRTISGSYFQREGRKSFSSGRRLDIIFEECKRRSGGDQSPWLFLKIQGDNAENTAKRILAGSTFKRSRKLSSMKKDELINLLGKSATNSELQPEGVSNLNKQNILALYGFGKNSKLCRALGDSMSPTILENDYLIADPDAKIENGNIIIVRVNSEVFVKRYSHSGDKIILKSDNVEYPQFEITNNMKFEIEGKVVRIVRNTD